ASSVRCTPCSCGRSSRSIPTRRARRAICRCCAGWVSSSPSSPSRGGWSAGRAPSWRPSRWPCRPCTFRPRRPPRARRSTCCSGSPPSNDCWSRGRPAGSGPSRSRGCSPRWRRSPATTPGWRCRWWRSPPGGSPVVRTGRPRHAAWPSSPSARRSCPPAGWPGARRPVEIRSSSPTTSRATTPSWRRRRARQLGVWSLGFLAAMTPPGALLAARALARGARGWSPAMRLVLVAALGPPAVYLVQGLVAQSFEPLARFALVPGALLLPLAAAVVPRHRARAFRAGAFAAAALFSLGVWLVATIGRERIWAGAESMGALTRLDGEDRALAAHLRAVRQPGQRVMIEPFSYADIGIAHAARIPWTEDVTLIVTREPGATVRDSLLSTGAEYLVGYDRPGGWPERIAAWPPGGARFGHWIVIGRGTPGAI